MKILYQSEITGKTYESEKALIEAEKQVSEAKKAQELKRQERAAAAKVLDEKISKLYADQQDVEKSLKEFCEKYGTYNTTLKKDNFWIMNPFNLISSIFDL